jgi:hypothetical protein
MRLLACIALLVVGATSAPAADVPRSCAERRCNQFTIVGREAVREGKDGVLVWTRGLWSSDTAEPSTVDAYFFCSTTRPARITVDDAGDTKTVMLAPLSAWEYDNHSDVYQSYFEACHDEGQAAVVERQNIAKRLGYRVLRIRTSRPLGLTRPESIFFFPPANRLDR